MTHNYPYKGFTIFVRPTSFAQYGDPDWHPARATPRTWGYRIDQIPGRCGIARGDDYDSKETAETAAEERIESWN